MDGQPKAQWRMLVKVLWSCGHNPLMIRTNTLRKKMNLPKILDSVVRQTIQSHFYCLWLELPMGNLRFSVLVVVMKQSIDVIGSLLSIRNNRMQFIFWINEHFNFVLLQSLGGSDRSTPFFSQQIHEQLMNRARQNALQALLSSICASRNHGSHGQQLVTGKGTCAVQWKIRQITENIIFQQAHNWMQEPTPLYDFTQPGMAEYHFQMFSRSKVYHSQLSPLGTRPS